MFYHFRRVAQRCGFIGKTVTQKLSSTTKWLGTSNQAALGSWATFRSLYDELLQIIKIAVCELIL